MKQFISVKDVVEDGLFQGEALAAFLASAILTKIINKLRLYSM